MALAHQLVVITRENPEENVWLDTERVFLSNLLFQYSLANIGAECRSCLHDNFFSAFLHILAERSVVYH